MYVIGEITSNSLPTIQALGMYEINPKTIWVCMIKLDQQTGEIDLPYAVSHSNEQTDKLDDSFHAANMSRNFLWYGERMFEKLYSMEQNLKMRKSAFYQTKCIQTLGTFVGNYNEQIFMLCTVTI